jgi:hypothetical protein
MDSLGIPFRIIWVEADLSKLEMMETQVGPKPRCVRISRRKAQSTESNAFEISNFRNKLEIFRWCRTLIVCCTSI